MKKVLILYKYLPQYRVDFFQQLRKTLSEHDIELQLIYGKSSKKDALKKDEADIEWAKFIPNKSLNIGNLQFIWQPCLRFLKDFDLVIVQPESKLILNYYLIF